MGYCTNITIYLECFDNDYDFFQGKIVSLKYMCY